jgi:L-amino acid N-acyltransferase YncA
MFHENTVSAKFHERLGFRKIGYKEKTAQLDGVWWDTALFERRSGLFKH